MANRQFVQFTEQLERSVVSLYLSIPIGATGAVGTISPSLNKGIYSVVRNSAGNYTINFGQSASAIDTYARLLSVDSIIKLGTVSTVGGVQVWADNASTGSIILQYVGPTNSSTTTPIAVDPDNGATLLISIQLKNSSI